MVHTISLSYVRLEYERTNCDIPKEPHVQFTLHPRSTLIEAWTFARVNSSRLVPLRTARTAIIGPSVKLNHPNFLMNEEAWRSTIADLVSELEVNLKTKEAIVDEIITKSEETTRNMDGLRVGDNKFNLLVTVRLYVSSVHMLDEDDIEDDEVITRLIDDDYDEEYAEEMSSSSSSSRRRKVAMIPASKAAIEGLEKVRVFGEMRCAVCLEDVKQGTQCSRLNCMHAFHGDCIRAWLERSHYCPLCRFPLPT